MEERMNESGDRQEIASKTGETYYVLGIQLASRLFPREGVPGEADKVMGALEKSTKVGTGLQRTRLKTSQIVSVAAAVLRSAYPPGDLSEFRIWRETAQTGASFHTAVR
ncbi:hypothetical protein Hamer_G012401 [Homarus americanus]|uniref:Uncharacterized protein n=1 Tax=Homarus americanus TaxID=6706 RepID=A0A8J5K7I7_HOMAM|nr:hypothetical protein Hamer_G012401 [Homarus americanus]